MRLIGALIRQLDWFLLTPAVLISIFSLLVIASGDAALATQQGEFLLVSLVVYTLVMLFDYRLLTSVWWLLTGFSLLLLGLVHIGGETVRGSQRWISLGAFQLQPSEPAKLACIVALSVILSKRCTWTVGRFLLSIAVVAPFLLLIFLQPDLGTALVFLSMWVGLVFVAQLPWKIWFLLAAIGSLLLPLGWNHLHDYQKDRLVTFLNPYHDPLGAGYNILQALIAVGSGEMAGRGFGRGTQSHLRFLPEQHTDFIFATFAEEWGFVGVFLLIVLYGALIMRILSLAWKSSTAVGLYCATGVAVLFLFQLLVNMGMNMGIMPVTGIPLPLFSYGGSALITYFAALGLVNSVARISRA